MFAAAAKLIVGLSHCLVSCRWWCQGQESTRFNTIIPSGTPDAPQGDQPVRRATNRTLSRLAASLRYVDLRGHIEDKILARLILLHLLMETFLVIPKVEQFWRFYSHMIRPGDLTGHSDFHLFKEGIKPMWEVGAHFFVLFAVLKE